MKGSYTSLEPISENRVILKKLNWHMLKVVENEFLDMASRQKVLDSLRAMKLTSKEQEVLTV